MSPSPVRPVTPQVWGEPMWRMIHIVAMGYPVNPKPEHRQAYKDFYMSLKTVLPCTKCASGYANIVNRHPIDDALRGPWDLFTWTVVVHNEVARKLGHPDMSPEYVKSVYIFGDDKGGDVAKDDQQRSDWMSKLGMTAVVLLIVAVAVWLFLRSQYG
nr:Erv1/Alr family protein [Oceanusvirus sp.]